MTSIALVLSWFEHVVITSFLLTSWIWKTYCLNIIIFVSIACLGIDMTGNRLEILFGCIFSAKMWFQFWNITQPVSQKDQFFNIYFSLVRFSACLSFSSLLLYSIYLSAMKTIFSDTPNVDKNILAHILIRFELCFRKLYFVFEFSTVEGCIVEHSIRFVT